MLPVQDLQQTATLAIQDSYAVLSSEQDLSPENPRITTSLTQLVGTLTQCQCPVMCEYLLTTSLLQTERDQLPTLCGTAEGEMEKYWARRLIAAARPNLDDFWYIKEYKALCDAEHALIKGRAFDRISFLGAGALPLTAFFLAENAPHADIVCVDFDAEACDLSAQLTRKIGLGHRIDIQQKDAAVYQPGHNELVICASLLNNSETVYANLERRSDCDLLIRDAEGSYRFLYRQAKLPPSNAFQQVCKTGLDSRRINTSRYYQPVARKGIIHAF